jgi:lipopolysaccharide/colanic/teichoic acid biosynthesis glycosyltransferase
MVISSPRVDAVLADLPDLPRTLCRRAEDLPTSEGPIVADLHADLSPDWEAAIVQATLQGRNVYHVKQISESLTGRVQIDHQSENALGTLAPDESYAFIKSVAEKAIAAFLLVILSPLFLAGAIAIRLDSPGPAIFRQTRIGLGGRPFTIFKLRTMAASQGPSTLERDMTQENDPRITRLGRFLRRSRIDEIPQLINILRGEMSFIGPRPETVNLSRWYADTIDFYAYRHVVLPGISGWAQVKQGHVTSTEDVLRKLQYDLYYIKNFSFWLDVVIVLKTAKIMLLKLGAK